jgi:hypothetical protein
MVRHIGRRALSVPPDDSGTGGRTRTGTLLRAGDFESPVSTNFTTPAQSRNQAASGRFGERGIIATSLQTAIIFLNGTGICL